MNLHEHIASLAAQAPTRAALVTVDRDGVATGTITYAELPAHIEAAASYLRSRGLARGDRVALAMDSGVEHLLASWAAWATGIVVVPLDTKRDTQELVDYKLSLTEAKMTLTELPSVAPIAVEWMPDTSHPALILFTSGTTAHPKGAKLTLENLVVNAQGIKEWLRVGPEDRFLVQLPLHHINSTTFCLTTLLAGGTIVMPPGYSNSHFWRQAAQTGATFTSVVQSIIFDQLGRAAEHAAVRDALKLSRIQVGSAPVVAHAAQEFIRIFGVPLYQGYGQTETALRVTGVPMDIPQALYSRLVEENSIGTPMAWARVEVMDESGAVLGEGEEGELVVKGAAVMEGYLTNEEVFRDGYFLTGDIGYYRTIDGRRYFYLKGRKKEIIIKGGINISPVAVENSLKKISADIDQAYVVGVADERYGEEVGAVVCFKEGRETASAMRALKLTLLLGTPELSAYETPRYLAASSVDALPTTSTGKVQRIVLKRDVPRERFEPIHELFAEDAYRFVVLEPHAPLFEASRELYNRCWEPLVQDNAAYKTYVQKNLTLMALDAQGAIAGQISFKRDRDALVCVSICSAGYRPKPVPEAPRIPTAEEVREYLLAGKDPVMNFHTKLGARLVEVTPGGRPEDKSALGYTMLLRYDVAAAPGLASDAPVSHRLIHAVLRLAHDLHLTQVDAVSRPGGLAAHVAQG